MDNVLFFGGIVFIVFGLAQLFGTFWQPLGRFIVTRSVFDKSNDPRRQRQMRLGWIAQTLAFILMGINLVVLKLPIDSTLRFSIVVMAAVLAIIPIVFKITNPEQ